MLEKWRVRRTMSEIITAVLDQIEAQIAEEIIELATGEVSLDFLQRIYRSTQQPMSLRMRAAIEALPFEKPKLSATAIATMDGKSFAHCNPPLFRKAPHPICPAMISLNRET